MKKEVKPNPLPKKAPVTNRTSPVPTQKTLAISQKTPVAPRRTTTPIKKPEYRYIGRETIGEIIGKAFPKQLIPTKRMGPIFGFIFIMILLLSILQFPLNKLIAGGENVSIAVGYPMTFLDFSLTGDEGSPLRIGGLIVDLLIYLIIAYTIDIFITIVIKNSILKSKEDTEKKPKVFKDKNPNIAEKVTKKVFKKESP